MDFFPFFPPMAGGRAHKGEVDSLYRAAVPTAWKSRSGTRAAIRRRGMGPGTPGGGGGSSLPRRIRD